VKGDTSHTASTLHIQLQETDAREPSADDVTIDRGPQFGERLRLLRQAAGLTQEELAERSGLTPAAVGMLERGERRRPYPQTLRALAEALELPAAERVSFFRTVARRGATVIDSAAAGTAMSAGRISSPPSPLTPLVGRRRDLSIISRVLRKGGARLLTLTGPGGVGKTRLAVEATAMLRAGTEVGPAWVDLAALRDPRLVLPAIARALGLAERGGEVLTATLENYLGQRSALFVLDNFEHLMPAAPLMTLLLGRCPGLVLLVTSRERLRISGEHEIQIQPLGLPGSDSGTDTRSIVRSDAGELFLQRVRAVKPDFVLRNSDASIVAAICSRLDGIPLALELAASQLKYASLRSLLEHLNSGLAVLSAGPRDLPARQRSLRATIAWSYNLLGSTEQELFRKLAVFGGSFSPEMVQAVCRPESALLEQIPASLVALADKSVVQARPAPGEKYRFTMLETVREYAMEQLVANGERETLADRHARCFCELAEAAAVHLTSAARPAALARLAAEEANLQAALNWTSTQGDRNIGLRLAGSLGWYWVHRGSILEGTHWTAPLLAGEPEAAQPDARASALYTAAALAWKRLDYSPGRQYAEESLAIRRASGDLRGLAFSLAIAGLIATSQDDMQCARAFQEESLSLFEQLGDRWGMAYARSNLGDVFLRMRDLAAARLCYIDSLEEFSAAGDRWGRGIVLHTLGNIQLTERSFPAAKASYAACVELFRTIGNRENTARSLIGLATTELRLGETDSARRHLQESLAIWREYGSKAGVALCLAGLAAVEVARGKIRKAARLFGIAAEKGQGQPPLYLMDLDIFGSYLEETRLRLGETAFAKEWTRGRAGSP